MLNSDFLGCQPIWLLFILSYMGYHEITDTLTICTINPNLFEKRFVETAELLNIDKIFPAKSRCFTAHQIIRTPQPPHTDKMCEVFTANYLMCTFFVMFVPCISNIKTLLLKSN